MLATAIFDQQQKKMLFLNWPRNGNSNVIFIAPSKTDSSVCWGLGWEESFGRSSSTGRCQNTFRALPMYPWAKDCIHKCSLIQVHPAFTLPITPKGIKRSRKCKNDLICVDHTGFVYAALFPPDTFTICNCCYGTTLCANSAINNEWEKVSNDPKFCCFCQSGCVLVSYRNIE